MPGLADRSRRPRSSPARLSADVETVVCQLRREHPRWGARRIVYELGLRGGRVPARATVHRVLSRNGLVAAQEQDHKRVYKRWQREAPMHLWQLDLVGGVPLADGRECRMVTGIDDHSRFVVIADRGAGSCRRAHRLPGYPAGRSSVPSLPKGTLAGTLTSRLSHRLGGLAQSQMRGISLQRATGRADQRHEDSAHR
jgi:hypothetical protein